jgi:hypothetical protein
MAARSQPIDSRLILTDISIGKRELAMSRYLAAAKRHSLACLVALGGLCAIASADENLLLRAEIINKDGQRLVVEQPLPARGEVTRCAGLLKAHTPWEANSAGREFLVDGDFCDGMVVQIERIGGSSGAPLVQWTFRSDSRWPVVHSLTENLRLPATAATLVLPKSMCDTLDVQKITITRGMI